MRIYILRETVYATPSHESHSSVHFNYQDTSQNARPAFRNSIRRILRAGHDNAEPGVEYGTQPETVESLRFAPYLCVSNEKNILEETSTASTISSVIPPDM